MTTVSSDKLEFSLISKEEALDRWLSELDSQKAVSVTLAESIFVKDSLNRITAEPVEAKVPYPGFYSSAIDGIAVKSSQTFKAADSHPVRLKVGKDAIFIDTGRPIPEGFDAVVPIEDVRFHSLESIEIDKSVNPWQNIRPLGEEISAKEIIIPADYKIRSLDIGAMLSGGANQIKVRAKPEVGFISLGDNLVSPGSSLKKGQVFESNSYILSNLVADYGGQAKICEISPEDLDIASQKLTKVLNESDLVIIIAGPHEGTHLITKLISDLGELVFYGVSIKPGQSVCGGLINKKPVIGLPHYPVATFIAFELFAKPILAKMLNIDLSPREKVLTVLSRNINSPLEIEEHLRVKLAEVGEKTIASPISRGADLLMSLVRADGILKIPSEISLLEKGTPLEIELLVPKDKIAKNLLMSGTYDICLDFLRNDLFKLTREIDLYISNVGSLAGLILLKDNLTHLASTHLFDLEKGEYNIPFVEKILPDMPVIVVNLFHRHLGLLIHKGNPKKIKDLQDLTRDDIKFINRNLNSGTRMILDYYLAKNKIDIKKIKGYSEEVYNHMSLAAAVASGAADIGVGIMPAARSFKLDFIPIIPERYDLVIPKKYIKDYKIQALLHIINSEKFKKEISSLGGYDTSALGKIVYES